MPNVDMATVTGCQSDEWMKEPENIWDPVREKEKHKIIKEKRNRIVNNENNGCCKGKE